MKDRTKILKELSRMSEDVYNSRITRENKIIKKNGGDLIQVYDRGSWDLYQAGLDDVVSILGNGSIFDVLTKHKTTAEGYYKQGISGALYRLEMKGLIDNLSELNKQYQKEITSV